tara:strand:+ start:2313 stop:2744 length:432 start_codon:yes stop_codon:yes gene_type:complete
MALDPKVWGPHYWFFLHTIALTYPILPNEVMRKKYYNFIQNLPLFLPIPEIGNEFSKMIDRYPVTPYLESRQDFIRWMHFIHNKINVSLDLPEKTLEETMTEYYEQYKPKAVKDAEERRRREKIVFIIGILIILVAAAYLYNK